MRRDGRMGDVRYRTPPTDPRDSREVGNIGGGCLRTGKREHERLDKYREAIALFLYLCRRPGPNQDPAFSFGSRAYYGEPRDTSAHIKAASRTRPTNIAKTKSPPSDISIMLTATRTMYTSAKMASTPTRATPINTKTSIFSPPMGLSWRFPVCAHPKRHQVC